MKNESKGKVIKSESGRFSRRIGSTTYLVTIHFSENGKDTFEDKVMRLIEKEVRKPA